MFHFVDVFLVSNKTISFLKLLTLCEAWSITWALIFICLFKDYSAKLRQIRLQNFNERRNIKDKLYVASPYSTAQFNVKLMIKGVDTTNNDIINAIRNRITVSIIDNNAALAAAVAELPVV